MERDESAPAGAVPLAAAIAALRAELTQAWTDAQNQQLRFRLKPVELTVEAAVTWTGKGATGINWWVLELGGEVSREKAVPDDQTDVGPGDVGPGRQRSEHLHRLPRRAQ